MCGISGFVNLDGAPASASLVNAMLDTIRHRGPDHHAHWANGATALGHVRLSIIDPSPRAHQPFLTANGDGVLVYVGEVYNFRSLRRTLEDEGVQFRSTSDTEVVLHALHRWGVERAVPMFDGMFALAYLDRRTNTLWLARDRIGIRPLYICHRGPLLAFASEMKALLAHPAVPRRPDMVSLATQIIYGRLTGNWTPFEDIDVVEPGTIHRVSEGESSVITYFDMLRDIDPGRIIANGSRPFDDDVNQFEDLLARSVEEHLVSDVPLAIMCSGGIDSGLTTAYASRAKPDIVAYVADVEGVEISEYARARSVCEHLGIELRRVPINQELYLRLWPDSVWHNDEPNFFAQNNLTLAVCRAVREDGFKVLITGEGSDELFGGYDWHAAAWHHWRRIGRRRALIPNNRVFRRLGRWTRWLAPPDIGRLMQEPFRNIGHYWPGQQPRGFVAAVDGGQRMLRQIELMKKFSPLDSLADRAMLAMSIEDAYTHLRTALASTEKMAMAVSLEARVPFIENRVIDFGLHLSPSAKYRRGVTKRVVKAAARRRLPRELVHVAKVGFGPNMESWTAAAPLLEGGMVADLFRWGRRERAAILAQIATNRHLLFHLISMELWAHIFLGSESRDALADRLLRLTGVAAPASPRAGDGARRPAATSAGQ